MTQLLSRILAVHILLFTSMQTQASHNFQKFVEEFITGYRQLNIPGIEYDYRNYLRAIPPVSSIDEQQSFFQKHRQALKKFNRNQLTTKGQTQYDHLSYEIEFNLFRLRLEKDWVTTDRIIPTAGIHSMQDHKDWYSYFVKKFTSTDASPEELFAFGTREVQRMHTEINALRLTLGFTDSLAFYKHLQSDTFYLTDKLTIIQRFESIDSTVRAHIPSFLPRDTAPAVYAMEWPGANQFTPPGIYLNHEQNAYGKDVFQFNFWNGRYNWRAMEWLYMHEAIPGHHLQSSFRARSDLGNLFLYPGNFEGWGCYIEYLGKDLGLYKDPYSYLGKWEWDLVRSVRIVLDVGIHYYGWTAEEALAYWRKNIPGQDDIAQREITRVNHWCGQALSYKVGADFIMRMKEEYLSKKGADIKTFHLRYLESGNLPLEVLQTLLLENS